MEHNFGFIELDWNLEATIMKNNVGILIQMVKLTNSCQSDLPF